MTTARDLNFEEIASPSHAVSTVVGRAIFSQIFQYLDFLALSHSANPNFKGFVAFVNGTVQTWLTKRNWRNARQIFTEPDSGRAPKSKLDGEFVSITNCLVEMDWKVV